MVDGITVLDVARELGLELDPTQAWSAGARVQEAYTSRFGQLPVKDLRRKTYGPGSHCFAIYPPAFRPLIENVLRDIGAADSAQGKLFDDD